MCVDELCVLDWEGTTKHISAVDVGSDCGIKECREADLLDEEKKVQESSLVGCRCCCELLRWLAGCEDGSGIGGSE